MGEVRILGAGAVQGFATGLARRQGIALSGTFGAARAILERFLADEACDLLVLTHAQIAQLPVDLQELQTASAGAAAEKH